MRGAVGGPGRHPAGPLHSEKRVQLLADIVIFRPPALRDE